MFQSIATIQPNYVDPGLVDTYMTSTWVDAMPDSAFRQNLNETTQQILKFKFGVTTNSQVGQGNAYSVPSLSYTTEPMSTPVYTVNLQYAINRDNAAMAANYGVDEAAVQQWLAEKSLFIQTMDATIFGINPSIGEGLLNATDRANEVLLASDLAGETYFDLQDKGEIRDAVIGHLNNLLMTNGMITAKGFTIGVLAPQAFWAVVHGSPIQLTSAQRQGAGTMTIWQAMLAWAVAYDAKFAIGMADKMEGHGINGADTAVFFIHEIKRSSQNNPMFDVSKSAPVPIENGVMSIYTMPPIEEPIPQHGGLHVHVKARMSGLWAYRGKGISQLSYTLSV